MRRTIIVLTSLLLAASVYVAHIGWWLQSEVVDRSSFVPTALASFEGEGSSGAIGSIVAARMVEAYPALRIVGSGLGSVLGDILATPPFEPALEGAAVDLHDRMLGGDTSAIVIDLADYEREIAEAVGDVSPALLALIPNGFYREYTLFAAGAVPDLADVMDDVVAAARLATFAIAAFLVIIVAVGRQMTGLVTVSISII